jgi:DNA-binding MarR family transcriptional regulator
MPRPHRTSSSKRTPESTSEPSGLADAARLSEDLDAIRAVLRDAAWQHARAHSIPLTPPQVAALQLLVDELRQSGDGLSLSELSRRMGLAHSTVSGIVTRLERRNLVERTTRPDDRRFASIELTRPAKGWVKHELKDSRLAPLAKALERARPAERTAILRGISALRALLTAREPDEEGRPPDSPSPDR